MILVVYNTLYKQDRKIIFLTSASHSFSRLQVQLRYPKNTKLNLCLFSYKTDYILEIWKLFTSLFKLVQIVVIHKLEIWKWELYRSICQHYYTICQQDFNLPDFLRWNAIGHLFQHFQHILGTNKNSQQIFKQFKRSKALFSLW